MESRIKQRKAWIAGLLTLLTIGLGHIYAGRAQRGICLYFLQFLLLILLVGVYLIFPNIVLMVVLILIGMTYGIYCIVDAIRITQKQSINFELKNYNKWYIYIIIYLITTILISPPLSFGVKRYLIQAYKIPSGAMLQTIFIGDHILTNKFIYKIALPNHGDIVVFPYPKDPSTDYIKRVIAVQGDKLEIRNKEVFLNDKKIEEPYVYFSSTLLIPKANSPRDNFGPIIIPDGKAFVMGDNRDNSYDSRFWGYVDLNQVSGKALHIYWSWNSESFSVRWGRIGLKL